MNDNLMAGLVLCVVGAGVMGGSWFGRYRAPPIDPATKARRERLDAEAEALGADCTSMKLTVRGPDGRDHVVCLEFDASGLVWVKKS